MEAAVSARRSMGAPVVRLPATAWPCMRGEPIGAYEPGWRLAPDIGAEPTSWLRVKELLGPLDTLWHAACAEADGVAGRLSAASVVHPLRVRNWARWRGHGPDVPSCA